jgi:hypothetical protein
MCELQGLRWRLQVRRKYGTGQYGLQVGGEEVEVSAIPDEELLELPRPGCDYYFSMLLP